jgi:hypothetical protein
LIYRFIGGIENTKAQFFHVCGTAYAFGSREAYFDEYSDDPGLSCAKQAGVEALKVHYQVAIAFNALQKGWTGAEVKARPSAKGCASPKWAKPFH